jgi:cbb3-type cytochrome oxidase subunit 3
MNNMHHGRTTAAAIGVVLTLFLGLLAFAPATAGAAGTLDAAASISCPNVPAAAQGTTAAWSFVPLSQSSNFLSRSAIHLIAGPGQTVTDTAVLTNYSVDTLPFNVYGSDAYNTKVLGTFTLHPPNVKPIGVGSWITLPVNNYDLPGCHVAEFHFTVKVPLNAAPGDHAGGIVALNLASPDASPQSGTNFAVQRGEGIAVYVRVPGPLHPGVAAANVGATYSSSPLGFGSNSAKVHYQGVNTGNEVLNGQSQVTVKNIFGSTVHTFRPVAIVALIPGGRMTVTEPKFSGLPFFGPVHLDVKMTTTVTTSTGSAQFWIVPWLLILIVIVVLALLYYFWRRRRKRKQAEEAAAPPPDGTPEVESDVSRGEPAPVL